MEYRISKVNRKSNFELLRIIAMILKLHIIFLFMEVLKWCKASLL